MADLTKWRPNENQLAVLEYLQDREYDLSVSEVCQGVGISRQAYYLWFDNPDFVQWWEDQHERFFTKQVPRVYAAIREGAVVGKKGGITAAQKLYLERFDARYMPKTKQEIDSRVTIEGLIAELDDDEEGEEQT